MLDLLFCFYNSFGFNTVQVFFSRDILTGLDIFTTLEMAASFLPQLLLVLLALLCSFGNAAVVVQNQGQEILVNNFDTTTGPGYLRQIETRLLPLGFFEVSFTTVYANTTAANNTQWITIKEDFKVNDFRVQFLFLYFKNIAN